MKYVRELWLLLGAAIFFLAQAQFPKPALLEKTSYLAPPVELKYVAGGFNSQFSDSFWMRSIQDTEYCEKTDNSDKCSDNSWFFSVVNLTVELDPEFVEAYYYGGLSLTTLIKDMKGASVIFDKGVVHFSREWPLLYAAAYHALFEEKNKLKASKLYLAASNFGAPDWVRLSAGKLAAEAGDEGTATEILQHLIQMESNPLWIKRLKVKLGEAQKAQNN